MNPFRLAAALLLSCFGVFLPSLLPARPKWDPVSAAELAESKPQLESGAAAEILDYRIEIDDTDRGCRIRSCQRIKIYDPARAVEATRFSRLSVGEDSPQHKLIVRLTLPDGSSQEFGKEQLLQRNLLEVGHPAGFLGWITSRDFWNLQEKFLAIPGIVPGAILDCWEDYGEGPRGDWLKNAIQYPNIPIRHFTYSSHYSTYGTKQLHRIFVLNPNGGHLDNDPKAGVSVFTASNLPSLKRESFRPPDSYQSLTIIETYEAKEISLARRSLKNPLPDEVPASLGPWAPFSTTMAFYDTDWGAPTRRVREKAAELIAGAGDEREKARRLFVYVQGLYQRFHRRADLENWYTRYVESSDELIELDKIDSTIIRSRDFYYLFIALARAAGLECHSVFHPVRTSFLFQIAMVYERFLSYRTVAVKANGEWILCEPCSDVPYAFGQLPWYIENQPALLALSHQQVFLNVTSPPAENSLARTEADLQLSATGRLQGECLLTLTGHHAHLLRERLSSTAREKWWQLARSIFSMENAWAEVRLLAVEGLEETEEPVRVRAALDWPAYAAILNDRVVLAPAIFQQGNPPLLYESERKTPVFFPYPCAESQRITIRLPSGCTVATLPKPIAATEGAYSYRLAFTGEDDRHTLIIERQLINRAVEIPLDGYDRARDWFRRVGVADQLSLVLPAAPTASDSSSPGTTRQRPDHGTP